MLYYSYGSNKPLRFLITNSQTVLMNITAKSTKEDIINESTVIITEQDELIASLKERQLLLFAIIGALAIYAAF